LRDFVDVKLELVWFVQLRDFELVSALPD
jgi:hypothetical protein